MTEEMRVALVAVAVGRGLGPDEAWDVVDKIDATGKAPRDLVREVYAAATDAVYPYS